MVAARGHDGAFAHIGVIENEHRQHILDMSDAPAPVSAKTTAKPSRSRAPSSRSSKWSVCLCVEFFVTQDGALLINELAPRPHNSGHLTFDACVTSQFEQQLRAVCGLPLGSTRATVSRVDGRISLGDLWVTASPTGRGLRLPTSSCTCTARWTRGPGARWDT